MIRFDYAQMALTQQLLAQTANSLEEKLERLRAELGALDLEWHGADREAYERLQAQWDSAAQNLVQILRALGSVLATAAETYQAAEQGNAGTFQ
jgi:early secretory antigenic target protein ESAT-6